MFRTRHPLPADVGLVVEVADSSRYTDRREKGRIYARAGLPVYWIVNLVDRVVEPTVPVSVRYRLSSRGRDLLASLQPLQEYTSRWEA